jgi:SH3-like domain-containing protein
VVFLDEKVFFCGKFARLSFMLKSKFMRCVLYLFAALAFCIAQAALSFAQGKDEGGQSFRTGASGLQVPRFVTLASDEVNMRTGPGLQYPITWVLVRESLPVEIIREFDVWREIRTLDGDEGWVHQSLLSGRRTAVIRPNQQRVFSKPETSSRPLAEVEPGVIVGVEECLQDWCYVDVLNYDGWMPKSAMWGVYDHEVFED